MNPAGMCLTSLQYGSGVMPNIFFEVIRNQQFYSEGLHVRGSIINGTTLTYGFVVRENVFSNPPPKGYYFNPVLGQQSGVSPSPENWVALMIVFLAGGQITVSAGAKSGVIEDNLMQDNFRQGVNNGTIMVDARDEVVLLRGNAVFH